MINMKNQTVSETPRTDAVIKEFEYSTVMLGGEIGGGQMDYVEPDDCRATFGMDAKEQRDWDEQVKALLTTIKERTK